MTIFEKIIEREIPAYIVYEDDDVISFLDISQATKGHTLVVPKKAYKNIYEMPQDLLAKVIVVTQKVSKAVDLAFQPEGLNILNNTNEIAGQTVFHFHIHIIPRYTKNDVGFKFENHMNDLSSDEFKQRAAIIKKNLL
ncbi:HIT family protein [Mycoplasmatota bacterium]|nr:HIT family protein [Mycoplasmatota bacterium]